MKELDSQPMRWMPGTAVRDRNLRQIQLGDIVENYDGQDLGRGQRGNPWRYLICVLDDTQTGEMVLRDFNAHNVGWTEYSKYEVVGNWKDCPEILKDEAQAVYCMLRDTTWPQYGDWVGEL